MSEHAKISYIKSAFRIVGFFLLGSILLYGGRDTFEAGIVLLVTAEVFGIIEEFGE